MNYEELISDILNLGCFEHAGRTWDIGQGEHSGGVHVSPRTGPETSLLYLTPGHEGAAMFVEIVDDAGGHILPPRPLAMREWAINSTDKTAPEINVLAWVAIAKKFIDVWMLLGI